MPDSYEAYDFPIIKAERQAPCTLRIMSFNIRAGGVNGNTIYDRITIGESQIFEIMPDSFGLQEATNVWMVALDERLTMYDWVGCEINTGGDVLKRGYVPCVHHDAHPARKRSEGQTRSQKYRQSHYIRSGGRARRLLPIAAFVVVTVVSCWWIFPERKKQK